MNYAIITENDSSEWNDKTGELYHFPKKYLKLIPEGTKVIYYKGKLKSRDWKFKDKRLTPETHYFGAAEIGRVFPDPKSRKNDHFAEIINFKQFQKPVFAKYSGKSLEIIPESRISNYWRDGVRPLIRDVYNAIIGITDGSQDGVIEYNDHLQGLESSLESLLEGSPKQVISTVYERIPAKRQQAVNFHGYSCMACNFNFGEFYGDWGNGFIHVHHVRPLAESGITTIDPKHDLIVLCANCHSMVHRIRKKTLSLSDIKELIRKNGIWKLK